MSGKLYLQASGKQNIYITGNPTYSHFLYNIKKHSRFAFETVETPLLSPELGNGTLCYIPLSGDLLTNMTLRYKLYLKTSPGLKYPLTEDVGIHAIEYADLFIGGTRIERVTGDWIYTYHKYHTSEKLFRNVVEVLSESNISSTADSGGDWQMKKMYIDLPFHFHKNLPASILSCKLTKQNCYVVVKFKSKDLLIHPNMAVNVQELSIDNASLLCRYGYLDTEELNFFKSYSFEKLITQTQLRRVEVPTNKNIESVILNFKHPVKTLYFFVSKKSRLYDDEYKYMNNDTFLDAELTINGASVFKETFNSLVHENSYKNAEAAQENIGSYSFSLYPLDNQPSGHLNFSRIIDTKFIMTLNDPTYTSEIQIYAVNYNILCYSSGLCGLKF